MMKVAVTGSTGLIGRALCEGLIQDGHQVIALGRSPQRILAALPSATAIRWEATEGPPPEDALSGADAVVNLAGESIASGRWTEARKRAIRDSRVLGTRSLVAAVESAAERPAILVNGSAIGYYGNRGDEPLHEESPPGSGFLAEVCSAWEAEASKAAVLGVRVVLVRTGVVLSRQGGALAKMLPPFKLFLGGPLGSGDQWMSWIHLQDEVRLIRKALTNSELSGPLNATAPSPRTNADFSKALGRVLKRPAILPTPGFVLKAILGEMAESLLLEGQRVYPKKAEQSGFAFRFAELEAALSDLLA